ncbi:helix-turn-helix domain-containing protein [Roseomonas sp. OT10]|uniref:IclR family transcriptional regulator n=1 Tax=Roseomonas cutis TaxID=2897332 RepID=UPI001E2A2C47|nr:helix-turn-helix domain-containing protein [Roseomonas sp. OT10]UFN50612.1 helix-turn-helix domain-containing protein [Roseomonas sp. OT10]
MRPEATGVAAVDRALLILQAWRIGDGPLPLRELHRRTGLYKSTILRLLASLERNRCVLRLSDGYWALGPMLQHWGQVYERGLDVPAIVRPALEQLGSASGEQASYWIRDGDMRVRLLRVPAGIEDRDEVGADRVPLGQGVTGRVLAAPVPPAGDLGVAEAELMESGESPETKRSVLAAAVFGPGGSIRGAITLAGPPERITSDLDRLRPLVLHTARSVSHALGAGLAG